MEQDDSEPQPLILFTPVPVRQRSDGWTVEKQYAFIQALAETGVVEEACRRVGMSRTSADKLRHRPEGAPFRRAWEAAIDYGLYHVEERAHRRARDGVARPIIRNGEQVGEYRHYDERLTMFLLRCYRPERYGRMRELPAPRLDELGEDLGPEDPGITLDGGLSGIEFDARDVRLDDDDYTPPLDGRSEPQGSVGSGPTECSRREGSGVIDCGRKSRRRRSPPPSLPRQGGGAKP